VLEVELDAMAEVFAIPPPPHALSNVAAAPDTRQSDRLLNALHEQCREIRIKFDITLHPFFDATGCARGSWLGAM